MKFAPRTESLTPFFVMELLEKARAMEARGEDIVHMEIGEPDFPSPSRVKQAGIDAIQRDRTFYTQSLGLPELRARIAEHYLRQDNVSVSPERVVVTNGTSGAFLLLCSVLLENGRTLGLSDPGYPCYKNFGALFGARIHPLPVSEETFFEVTPDMLSASGTTPDLLILSNPVNPTGTIYRDDTLAGLERLLSRTGGSLVVDEIYRGLAYGKRVRTALGLSDRIIVVDGFSKVYAMTGWRLGWMVVPEELVRPAQIVAQNVFISPPTVSQYSALEAFDATEDVERMRTTYGERRDFLLPELKRLGFRIPVDPEGAFYIYADIGPWKIDSRAFSDRALQEAKVALTPGYDFGSFKPESHIRFSYATDLERLRKGVQRLEGWLKTLRP